MPDDTKSETSTESHSKTSEWLTKALQKSMKFVQSEENKKYIQVFLLDPILTHVLNRIFPYVVILSVLFTVLTCMVAATLILVFLRVPGALGPAEVVKSSL